MNEAAAEADSPSSDSESCPKLSKPPTTLRYNSTQPNPYNSRPLSIKKSQSSEKGEANILRGDIIIEMLIDLHVNSHFSQPTVRPTSLTLNSLQTDEDPKEIDFFTKQARLQIEARMALAQAKDMAHMQMEVRVNLLRLESNMKNCIIVFRILRRWNVKSRRSRQSQTLSAVRSKRSASIFRRRNGEFHDKC